MKGRIRTLVTSALVALTIGLFALAQSTSAVSDCKFVEGNLSVVNNGNGTTSGTITNGDKLNGTTQAFSPVPLRPRLIRAPFPTLTTLPSQPTRCPKDPQC